MNPHKKDLVKTVRVIANWFDQRAEESSGDADGGAYWGHLSRARALDEAAAVLESYNNILFHLLASRTTEEMNDD